MNLSELAKEFFKAIEKRLGPFDRPFRFRPFPFDAGGALNFLTIGSGQKQIVTYISWDLFGHEKQKRSNLGRYEFLIDCDSEQWVLNILTNIGRQSLTTIFEPGDTLDIGPWVGSTGSIQGIVFAEALQIELEGEFIKERCGLLRCIGITRYELEFANAHGVQLLIERLKRASVFPYTITHRNSIDLAS